MEIVRVLAPNAGPYTGPGTNSYLVHDKGQAYVIDPGPIIDSHRDAIVASLGELTAAGVIVTHNHPDHAPLANPLAESLGVASFGFAPGPEFTPDVLIGDGDEMPFGDSSLVAVHTPGHTADHICLLAGSVLFTGDHIMGGSTVIIEDAVAYFESLYKVEALGVEIIQPGHGDVIEDAADAVSMYIEHRKAREHQVIDAVRNGAHTVREITEAVYGDVDPQLIPAALAQVEVQLEKLTSENRLSLGPTDTTEERVVMPGGGFD